MGLSGPIIGSDCTLAGTGSREKEAYLERLECFCEFLAKIIRQMGISCLTEHFTTVWIPCRRVMCTFRGIELHNTENTTYRSDGGLSPHPRAFHSLLEVEYAQLKLEVELAELTLEWVLISPPDEPIELILELAQATVQGIRILMASSTQRGDM